MSFLQHYRLFWLVSFVIILLGCTQTVVPRMPDFTTDREKSCARQCQSIYAQCNSACGQMIGGIRTANQRQQCMNNCNAALEDCYRTCKE